MSVASLRALAPRRLWRPSVRRGSSTTFLLAQPFDAPAVRRVPQSLGVRAWVATVALLGASSSALALTALPRRTDLIVAIALAAGAAAATATYIGAWRARVIELARLTRTDQLTAVANRTAWDEELPREIARAQRDETALTVAVLDIDRLDAFNGLRGHAEGDLLLRRTAAAWSASLRTTDFIARLDGGRFGVILHRCALEHALVIVERLRTCVPEAQTASAGIASWDRDELAGDVVARAEAALDMAKSRGRDQASISPPPALSDQRAVDDWTATVRDLLDQRLMVSAYQPIVDLSSGRVVAYEALARPDSHQLPDISVERMFTTAQRLGLARELDWLCRRAALADTSWLPQTSLLFINCNAGFLVDPLHRVDHMLLVLEAAGVSARQVVLEITERELAGDLARLRTVVDAYRREGFRFAIDDVGEGHSTLEVLAAVRPEYVKVARSLVVESGGVGARAAIRAVVAFAQESGASVIAEGIEDPQTAARMTDLGVDLAQGFLFGRPAFPAAAA